MITSADLGLEVLVEVLVSSFNEPTFSGQALSFAVEKSVSTAINSAVKPRKSNGVDVLLQVQHESFFPTSTWKNPFKDLREECPWQGHPCTRALAFSLLLMAKNLLFLWRVVADVSPLTPLRKWKAKPNFPRSGFWSQAGTGQNRSEGWFAWAWDLEKNRPQTTMSVESMPLPKHHSDCPRRGPWLW